MDGVRTTSYAFFELNGVNLIPQMWSLPDLFTILLIFGGGKPRMAGEAIGGDAAAAAEGNKVGEAIGKVGGNIAGTAVGAATIGTLDGPLPFMDVVGGTIGGQIGEQIGGTIGAHIPQLPTAQANQDAMLTGQHQQLISARDPRSQSRLPLGQHVVY